MQELDPCRKLSLSFPLENLDFTPQALSFSYTFHEAAFAWSCPGENFKRPNQDVTDQYSYRGRIQRSEPYKGALMLNPNDTSILVLYKTSTSASGANQLLNERAQNVSGSTYSVSVDYKYVPAVSGHSGSIRIAPVTSSGKNPGYTYSRNPERFSAGSGTVTYSVTPFGDFSDFEFCLFEIDPQSLDPPDPLLCQKFPRP
jgi:hypothetical protein